MFGRDPIKVFRHRRIVRCRDGRQLHAMQLIARGTGTLMYESKPCETACQADTLVDRYLVKNLNLVDTTETYWWQEKKTP